MNKESSSIENVENLPAHENHEAVISPEKSAEEVGEQMLEQAGKEIADFQQEGNMEFTQIEERAEKSELSIDGGYKAELQELNTQAEDAKEEMVKEITPLPLPEEYLRSISSKGIDQREQAELKAAPDLAEKYIQKSKIADKDEALQKLMAHVGASSREELDAKLKEKDEDGYPVIKMFTPDSLFDESAGTGMSSPSLEILKEIRNCGNVLGYSYANTPEYKSRVDDTISRLRRNGKKEEALEVENIFREEKIVFEEYKEKSEFKKIDENLAGLFNDEEKFKEYIEGKKNLPPDAIVHLYHGLNKGGYDVALKIIDGPSHGIEQHSGPTVSLAPAGGFWHGVGFRYALRRDQIEFPGENNPNAVVRMQENKFGNYSDGVITHESGSLPMDQFEAEVMRSGFTLPSPELEKEIAEKMRGFAEARAKHNEK